MGVSREEVRKIAGLARLHPPEEAIGRLTDELNAVLEHVRVLEGLDLSGVDESSRVSPDPLAYRDPELAPDPLAPEAPRDRAPDWRDGFFAVPRLPALDGGSEGKEGA